MYKTIIKNLKAIYDETGKTVMLFEFDKGLLIAFDNTDDTFYWTDVLGDYINTASQQSVVSVLGSQYGQSSI